MKRLTALFFIFTMALAAGNTLKAQDNTVPPEEEAQTDSSYLKNAYLQILDSLARERDSLNAVSSYSAPNAYYWELLTPPTLFVSPLHQMMSRADSTTSDLQLQRLFSARERLSAVYTRTPWLVKQTELDLKGQAAIRNDVNDILKSSDKLAEKVADAALTPTMDEPVEVFTRRPNFWKFSGSTSLNFTQNHFSENWYKGGESNFSGTTTLTVRANYNDQRKINWENTLDAQLGVQTTDNDQMRSFRITSNPLRYTTNFGYRAWKSFFYSMQVILATQLAPIYQKDKDFVTSTFLSPLEVTVAPGMKWDIAWGKKKQFTGTLNVAPLAMKVLYVHRDTLVTNFGIEKGDHSRTTFGPNVTLNTRWQICKQIAWTSRVYWMTNYDYDIVEWENTIDFSITKIITAKAYLYPRYDDSNPNYRSGEEHDGTFIMFKEWFSLGLSYNF